MKIPILQTLNARKPLPFPILMVQRNQKLQEVLTKIAVTQFLESLVGLSYYIITILTISHVRNPLQVEYLASSLACYYFDIFLEKQCGNKHVQKARYFMRNNVKCTNQFWDNLYWHGTIIQFITSLLHCRQKML